MLGFDGARAQGNLRPRLGVASAMRALALLFFFSLPVDLKWTELPKAPSERFACSAVWNPRDATMLLFAGEVKKGDGFDFFNDLWEFSPKESKWTEVRAEGKKPDRRGYQAAAWDTKQNVLWVFGGAGDGLTAKDDLWKFDPAAKKWTEVEGKGETPGARFSAALHFDPKKNRLLRLSGCRKFGPGADNVPDDLRIFDIATATWSASKAKAPGRWQCASAFDPEKGILLVHGGFDGSFGVLTDTRLYDANADKWEKIGSGGLKGTDAHTAVWDAAGKQFLAYGGASSSKHGLEDLWAFDPKSAKWSKLAGGTPGPGPRAYHAMALNDADKTLYVFGGTENQFNDPAKENRLWAIRLRK